STLYAAAGTVGSLQATSLTSTFAAVATVSGQSLSYTVGSLGSLYAAAGSIGSLTSTTASIATLTGQSLSYAVGSLSSLYATAGSDRKIVVSGLTLTFGAVATVSGQSMSY